MYATSTVPRLQAESRCVFARVYERQKYPKKFCDLRTRESTIGKGGGSVKSLRACDAGSAGSQIATKKF